MSARSSTVAPSPLRRTPTTPVPPTPSCTSNPALRSRPATRPAVRCSWCDSSGCWWTSRYSSSCHDLELSRPASTDRTAESELMAPPQRRRATPPPECAHGRSSPHGQTAAAQVRRDAAPSSHPGGEGAGVSRHRAGRRRSVGDVRTAADPRWLPSATNPTNTCTTRTQIRTSESPAVPLHPHPTYHGRITFGESVHIGCRNGNMRGHPGAVQEADPQSRVRAVESE